MSNGYGCAFGDDSHKVNWLITRLSPAATISLCDDDFPVGIIPVLASELGVDGARLYDTIKRFTDREQAREAKEAEQARRAEAGDDQALDAQYADDPDGYAARPGEPGMFPPNPLPGHDSGDDTGVDAEDAVWGEPTAEMLRSEQ